MDQQRIMMSEVFILILSILIQQKFILSNTSFSKRMLVAQMRKTRAYLALIWELQLVLDHL